MKSRLLFRETGHVVRTRREPTWWTAALGAVLVVMLYVYAAYLDDRAEQREEQRLAELERSFAAGRQEGHREMVATAEAGWQAALHCTGGAR